MDNSTVIVSAPNNVIVTEARDTFIRSVKGEYGAGRKYAESLIGYFDALGFGVEWITMPHDAKGPAGDAMRTERDTLYKGLKEAGHSNPSVKWKQIKGYALELVTPKDAEGKAETESKGDPKHTRSTQLTLVEDLTRLYKHCKRNSKELTDAQRKVHVHISAALADLGIDVGML